MIARIWRASATEAGAHHYVEYFRARVLTELMAIAGFRAADVLVRPGKECCEILVITKWESETSVQQFAGKDISIANVEPEATQLLRTFDTEVANFVVQFSADVNSLEQKHRGSA